MKLIESISINTNDYSEYYGKGSVCVSLVADDGKHIAGVSIFAGEPEDNTFFRDLSSAESIGKLVREAYEAGKRGEKLEIISKERGE